MTIYTMEESMTYDERMKRISRYFLCMVTYDRNTVEYEILRRELALEMDAVHAQRKKGARNIPLSM